MHETTRSRVAFVPLFVAACIVLAWSAISIAETGRLAFAVPNEKLVRYGALTPETLRAGEFWRIACSQFLHVYGLHALLNATAILSVGSLLQASAGRSIAVLTLLCGGIAGQLVAVAVTPGGVATGASQAALSLCATAALIGLRSNNSVLLFTSATYVLIQAALDLSFAGHLKSPHVVSVLVGLSVGTWSLYHRNTTPPKPRSAT